MWWEKPRGNYTGTDTSNASVRDHHGVELWSGISDLIYPAVESTEGGAGRLGDPSNREWLVISYTKKLI
jgi:hypothetical protein